jgi:uncharacterized protein (DUF1330 family)
MPAYFVCQVFVTDPEAYEDYRHRVPPTIEKYGGKALVRGFAEPLEGDDPQSRMVIIEFEDAAALKRWYESDEVRPLNAMRQKASRSRAVMLG